MVNNLSGTSSGTFSISSGTFNINTNIHNSTTIPTFPAFPGVSTTGGNLITNGTINTTNSYHTYPMTSTYKLWDGEVEGLHGTNALVVISLLNVLGTAYWDQMLLNNVELEMDSSLYEGIQDLYKKQKRKESIDILLNDEDEDF